MEPSQSTRYRFDDVEVDPRGFRVMKGGKPLPLEPKALSVLVFLVENHGRLIEKTELINAVWGDTFVTENVLTRAIGQLRKALGDDAKETRYIETVPTRGYRFIGIVSVEENGGGARPATAETETTSPVVAPSTERLERRGRELRRYAIAIGVVLTLGCIVAAAFLALHWRSPSEYLQLASSTQITTSIGLSFNPTLSPDGTEIAYSTDRGKGFEIFVRQLTTGGKEIQLTSDGNQNFQPAWSPDGSSIAYSSRIRGGVWIMPSLGGAPRELSDFGSHPSWSRDGRWIAFESDAIDDLSSDSTGIGIPSSIWSIRPDGSDLKKITTPGQPDGGHGAPSWSPDSKRIVFVSSFRGSSNLWCIGVDGTGLVSLGARAGGYYDPIYMPDGKSVIFGAFASRNSGLWQLRVSPDTGSPSGPPVQITNSSGSRIKNLSISSDGKKLLYASVGLVGGLQSLPVSKSTEPTGEPISLVSDVGCRDILPVFSPDGSRLAFNSCHGRAGSPEQVWLMNAGGSNLQQVTSPSRSFSAPSWYRDGRHLLIPSGRQFFSVDLDTRQQKLVTTLNQDANASQLWPDGDDLALSFLTNGIQNIWILNLASNRLKQITFDKEDAGYPAWSPDGKFIALEIERGADNAIAIVSRDGGALTELTPYRGQHWLHDWSPDGDKVLYAKPGEDLIWNIWSVSRATKVEKQLTHYKKTNAYVRYPAMSPRGDQIVYEYTENTGNIWMMQFK